jgi:hypothetical protein
VPIQRYRGLAEIRLGAALAGQKQYQEAERHARASCEIPSKGDEPCLMEMREVRKAPADIYTALNDPSKAKALQDTPGHRNELRSTGQSIHEPFTALRRQENQLTRAGDASR